MDTRTDFTKKGYWNLKGSSSQVRARLIWKSTSGASSLQLVKIATLKSA